MLRGRIYAYNYYLSHGSVWGGTKEREITSIGLKAHNTINNNPSRVVFFPFFFFVYFFLIPLLVYTGD